MLRKISEFFQSFFITLLPKCQKKHHHVVVPSKIVVIVGIFYFCQYQHIRAGVDSFGGDVVLT